MSERAEADMLRGLSIPRVFTRAGESPYDSVAWTRRTSRITNPDGTVVFEMADAEVPAAWSQVAADIMVSKYFRKAGVPQVTEDGSPVLDENDRPVLGPEQSARQVIHRLAGCWRHWGEENGYFATAEDALAFYDELAYMLLHQMAAPNSPQWFNTGLAWAYGITGPAQGHYFVDPADGEVKKSVDAYTRPQPHACFIQSVQDTLVGEGGLMDLWVREARIFKYGSGTGTNFSAIRGEGEKLSGGGTSSGLMSFLKVGDRAAGAIKSGGTTRRAAKMVIVDVDHPDVEKFIDWKADEEKKVAALIAAGYSSDFNGEAYATVSARTPTTPSGSPTTSRGRSRDGVAPPPHRPNPQETVRARDLGGRSRVPPGSAPTPGLQYDTRINGGTLPATGDQTRATPARVHVPRRTPPATSPLLNLIKFSTSKPAFDIEAYRHAIGSGPSSSRSAS
jgi:ribonucleoside-diphosphate reductase alpha chain